MHGSSPLRQIGGASDAHRQWFRTPPPPLWRATMRPPHAGASSVSPRDTKPPRRFLLLFILLSPAAAGPSVPPRRCHARSNYLSPFCPTWSCDLSDPPRPHLGGSTSPPQSCPAFGKFHVNVRPLRTSQMTAGRRFPRDVLKELNNTKRTLK